MKVTKRQLKQIIKEELEATMAEQGGDEKAQAEELAAVFQQSPTIMAAVRQAAQDPKVLAAAQGAAAEMTEEYDHEEWKGPGPSNKTLAYTAAGIGIGGYAGAIAGTVGQTAAVMALGLTGGVALAAIGLLVAGIVSGQIGGGSD